MDKSFQRICFRRLLGLSSMLIEIVSGEHCRHFHRTIERQQTTNRCAGLFLKPDRRASNDATRNLAEELTAGKMLHRSTHKDSLRSISFVFCLLSDDVLRLITDFYRHDQMRKLSGEQGLDTRLFQEAYVSFRKFCLQSSSLPVDLHLVLSDVIEGSGEFLFSPLSKSIVLFFCWSRSSDRYFSLLYASCPRNLSSFELHRWLEEDQRSSRSCQLVKYLLLLLSKFLYFGKESRFQVPGSTSHQTTNYLSFGTNQQRKSID